MNKTFSQNISSYNADIWLLKLWVQWISRS